MPVTTAGLCLESARAASLATHSAASMAASAGHRDAARLLGTAEVLSRSAAAALASLSLPKVPDQSARCGTSADVTMGKTKTRRRRKKKAKSGKADAEGTTIDDTGMLDAAAGSAVLAASPTPSPAGRSLQARSSRERSPRGVRSTPPASITSGSPPARAGSTFSLGQAVMLTNLVSRQDLEGKCGVVKGYDSASSRYMVALDVGNENVRVLESNLRASIFLSTTVQSS